MNALVTDNEHKFTEARISFVTNALDVRLQPECLLQCNKTPSVELWRDGIASLYYYPALNSAEIPFNGDTVDVRTTQFDIPILLVPPLGVHAWVYDLLNDRSWVRYFLSQGFKVYLLDWGTVSKAENSLSLDDYVLRWLPQVTEAVRKHSGQPELSLMGYCMGGLLSLIYVAATKDKNIRNLVTVASPVDFHRMGLQGLLLRGLSLPVALGGKKVQNAIKKINTELFHVPRGWITTAFKMTDPIGNIASYFDLIANMADRDYVSARTTMSRWFNDMVDYPGGVVRDVVMGFAVGNSLARNSVVVGGKKVDLKDVQCSVLSFAGRTDVIVSVAAAKKMMRIVGSKDKAFHVVPGGHAGVFAGGKAAQNTFRFTADWLSRRSDAKNIASK